MAAACPVGHDPPRSEACPLCERLVDPGPRGEAFRRSMALRGGGAPAGPCAHLGKRARTPEGATKTKQCLGCGGKDLEVFECGLLGECTLADCRDCPHWESRQAPARAAPLRQLDRCDQADPSLSAEEMLALIRSAPPGPWPKAEAWDAARGFWKDDPAKTWHCWPNTQEAMRRLCREFIDGPLAQEVPGPMAGRGIIVAGGLKPLPNRGLPHGYFPCVWLLATKLRRMGCALPVQLWHLGLEEMDPHAARLLAGLGVECVDAREVAKRHPARILCGWELKPFAALHCPFAEVLFLDADNCPVNHPVEELFGQPEYLELGACFWPDYAHWDLAPGVWEVFGMEARHEPAFESGQFLIDKRRCRRELRLALWYAEYSDFTFGHVYGDKEVFHLAWRKLGTEYAMPAIRPGWEGELCIVQHDTRGRRVLLHRCQDKWKLDGGNAFLHWLEDEDLHHAIVRGLREVWTGKPWHNPSPGPREAEAIARLAGRRFRYRRLPEGKFKGDERDMVLEAGGKVGLGAAACEARWDINEVAVPGQPSRLLLSLSSEEQATCLLSEEDGTWRGQWLDHERCPVELVPADALSPERDAAEAGAGFRAKGYAWTAEDREALAALLGRRVHG
jgi:hypothetical protein